MVKKQKMGFTLSELLVVIIVVAVLSAIAVPMYAKAVKRSRASDALKVLSVAAVRQEAYFIDNNEYADNFGELSAPVKGLSGQGSVKVGQFDYTMDKACVVATPIDNKAGYQIYRNFQTQQDGCVGEGCTVLMDLIPTLGSVGCDLHAFGNSDGNTVDDDFCAKNPHLCDTSTPSNNCPAGKVYNPATATCVCSVVCGPNAIQNPSTCACSCPSSCSVSGQVMDTTTCDCYCPANAPYVYNGKCNTCKEGSVNTSTGQCCPAGNCYDSTQGICRPDYSGPSTESQSCGAIGTQTRSRTSGCPGTWGSWGTCVCPSGYTLIDGMCKVCASNSTQNCGNKCGTQKCASDGMSWGACTGEGVCSTGDKTSEGCSFGGSKICTAQCAWPTACEGEGTCTPGATQKCGTKCGVQTCSSSYQWGECEKEGQCNEGGTACDVNCQCEAGHTWDGSACKADSTECDDSQKPLESQDCGNCGTQTRSVTCNTSSGTWTTGSWDACTGEGVCAAGSANCSSSCSCTPGFSWSGTECGAECEASIGSWASSATAMDTCPGNDSINEYSCSGVAVNCIDVRGTINDVEINSTTTRSVTPPSGYVMAHSCSSYNRDNNIKIAVPFDGKLKDVQSRYAYASCTSIESGDMQKLDDFTFYTMKPTVGGIEKYYSNGELPECPYSSGGSRCEKYCQGLGAWNDTKGCTSKVTCYNLNSLNKANCEHWPTSHSIIGNGASVYTCDIGAGMYEYKYKLIQCGYRYEKRDIKCCTE